MSIRTRRVGHEIRRIISELIERGEIRDPRLSGMISITDVEVTPDLQTARVFYSCFGTPEDAENTAKAIESAAGFIQLEVGRRLNIKFTPKLTFERDASMAYGDHIERVLGALDYDDRENENN